MAGCRQAPPPATPQHEHDPIIRDTSQPASRDTAYTLSRVFRLAGEDSCAARRILDSVERWAIADDYRTIPDYEIEIAKAFVASRALNPNSALQILKVVLSSKALREDTSRYLYALGLSCNEYMVLNRQVEYLDCAKTFDSIARLTNDPKDRAKAYSYLCEAYYQTGEYEIGLEYIRKALQIYEQDPSPANFDSRAWCMEEKIHILQNLHKDPEAITTCRQIIDMYDRIPPPDRKGTEVESDEVLNYKRGLYNLMLAILLIENGEQEQAARHYRISEQMQGRGPKNIVSSQLRSMEMEYLIPAGRYEDALEQAEICHREATLQGDTINNNNQLAHSYISNIYQKMGNYTGAWRHQYIACILKDSLNARANYATMLELRTLYETERQQKVILQQQATLSQVHFWLAATLAVTLLLGMLSLLVWRHSRQITRKNRVLFDQNRDLREAHAQLESIRQSVTERRAQPGRSVQDRMNALFQQLEELMNREQAYREPEFSKDECARQLGTNKLYLSNAISNCLSMSFSEYISHLRLEYARELLQKDPDKKIEAIAMESGFRSVRTFYRLFRESYGMPPAEFRITAEAIRQQPVS